MQAKCKRFLCLFYFSHATFAKQTLNFTVMKVAKNFIFAIDKSDFFVYY